MGRGLHRATLVVLTVALVGFVASASANHSAYSHISAGARKGNGSFAFTFGGASTDGTRVFFETDEQLTNDDIDLKTDVYQRAGGVTTLVSKGQLNGNGAFPAAFRAASADGSRVFFTTEEKLTGDDADTTADVYELSGGVTTRISKGQVNGNGAFPAIFQRALVDGSAVFFTTAEKLTSDDTDTALDVYERSGGVTTRISKGEINGNGAFDAYFAGVSTDGSRVFFVTGEQLVSDDTDTAGGDIYKRAGGTTTLVSDGAINGDGNYGAGFVGASADGTHVFFITPEQLTANDLDTDRLDIYERAGGTTTLVSEGTQGYGSDPMFVGASADGSHVFFETSEQVTPDDNDSWIDVYERFSSFVRRVSQGESGTIDISDSFFRGASADGSRVFFETLDRLTQDDTNGGFDVYERFGGVGTTRISQGTTEVGGSAAFFGGASTDGTRVYFVTDRQLKPGDTDSNFDVYERSGFTTTLISKGQINGNGPDDASFRGASADGSKVFFASGEQLTGDDVDGGNLDLYQRSGGTTTRLSTGDVKGNGPLPAFVAGSSANGARVFFTTAEQLTNDDIDLGVDLYQRSGGTTTRLSAGLSEGPLGVDFRGASADGSKVYFTTAEPLTPSDGDASVDIYERSGGTTTRVSEGAENGDLAYDANFAGLSADGSKLFFTTGEQLNFEDVDSSIDIYRRSEGSPPFTERVSEGPVGGDGAFDSVFRGASSDGSKVVFTTAEKLTTDDADSAVDVYQWSSATSATRISQGPGTGNSGARASYAGESADGGKVFFTTAEKLTGDDTDTAVDLYQRAGGVTTRISRGAINGNGAFPASFVGASLDGTHVFFTTAEKLVSGDTDGKIDIYERAGLVTTRISQGAINGNGAFDATFRGSSGDGLKVFFTTPEKLTSDDTDAAVDLYQRAGGSTIRISKGAINSNGGFPVTFCGASADGSRVFFTSEEKLTSDDTDGEADIFERFGGVTTRISKGDVNGNGAFPVGCGVASSDGLKVFFETAEKLATADTDGATDVYSAAVP